MGESWKRQSFMAFLLMRRATIYRLGAIGISVYKFQDVTPVAASIAAIS
jgi:hypothetical protein